MHFIKMKGFFKAVLYLAMMIILTGSGLRAQDSSATSLKPSFGGPGTMVTIYGRNLGDVMGKGKVLFGTVEARVISWTYNAITVIVPSNLKSEDLTEEGKKKKRTVMPITIILDSSERISAPGFDGAPEIVKLSPDKWTPGGKIRAVGRNFGNFADAGKVNVGGREAKIVSWTDRQVEFILADNIDADKVMTQKEKKGRGKQYAEAFISAGDLKSPPEPLFLELALEGFLPAHPSCGQVAVLKGSGFGKSPEKVKIMVGKISVTPLKAEDNRLEFRIPENIEASELDEGRIKVMVMAGELKAGEVLMPVAPEIKSLKPSRGDGRHLTVHGSGFGSGNGSEVLLLDGEKSYKAVVSNWSHDSISVSLPETLKEPGREAVIKVQVKVFGLKSGEALYHLKTADKAKKEKGSKKGVK